jgi:hypothetical protein
VALIGWLAHNRIAADTDAGLAGIGLGTCVAVVASSPIWLVLIRACARRLVADAGLLALAGCGADDRIAASALAGLTRVRLCAGILIVTGFAVRLGRIRTETGLRIADTYVVAVVAGGADDKV